MDNSISWNVLVALGIYIVGFLVAHQTLIRGYANRKWWSPMVWGIIVVGLIIALI